MKNLSKKVVSLGIIFTILMAIFMPTMVSAGSFGRISGQRVTFNEIGTSTEQVASTTNMEEYINSKKDAFIGSMASANITVDLNYSNIDPNTLFSTTSPYKYATVDNCEIGYAFIENALIQVYTVNYTLVNVTKSSTSTEITGTTKYPSKNGDVINSYNITSDVVTLYVGNISVDGTSTLKYLYTDKSVNAETLTEVKKILTTDYAGLLPTTAGQVAVCNDNSVTVNDVYTDAGMVAINKYPSGTVSDTSTTILYNQTQFNSLATASATEVSDESNAEVNNLSGWNTRKTEWETTEANKLNTDPNYTPVDFPEEYRNIFNDNTSYPTTSYFIADNKGTSSTGYIIRNGAVAQVDTYPINRTIIKVVNTSANVTMPVSATSIASTYVTLKAPRVGDKVEKITKNDGYGDYEAQSTQPTVSTTTEGLVVSAYWVKGLKELSEESFYGTFEEDTYYYALIDFEAQEGYELPATFPDGIKVNGKSPDEVFAVYGGKWNHCVAKIKATTAEEVTPTYEYIDNTANQNYTINKDDALTFRINADYSLFENGGVVYVDGTGTTEYTSKSGSTIITLNKDFVNSLSVGEHTLKVAFNNGGEATTKFTIAKAEETTPTETATTEETTPTETATTEETTPTETATAEETKAEESTSNNPKTGDNIAVWISLMVVSMLGVVGTIKYTKKRK